MATPFDAASSAVASSDRVADSMRRLVREGEGHTMRVGTQAAAWTGRRWWLAIAVRSVEEIVVQVRGEVVGAAKLRKVLSPPKHSSSCRTPP